jgi:single-strand DNA-binding protein
MSNEFEGIGNLGMAPQLTIVDGLGEQNESRSVCNLRVYFDRQVPDRQDGGFKDKGGFWITVDIWGFRADEAMRLLKKGSRIFVKGNLREESWTDESSGEVKKELRLTADSFFIDSLCVESLVFKTKRDVNPNAE